MTDGAHSKILQFDICYVERFGNGRYLDNLFKGLCMKQQYVMWSNVLLMTHSHVTAIFMHVFSMDAG